MWLIVARYVCPAAFGYDWATYGQSWRTAVQLAVVVVIFAHDVSLATRGSV